MVATEQLKISFVNVKWLTSPPLDDAYDSSASLSLRSCTSYSKSKCWTMYSSSDSSLSSRQKSTAKQRKPLQFVFREILQLKSFVAWMSNCYAASGLMLVNMHARTCIATMIIELTWMLHKPTLWVLLMSITIKHKQWTKQFKQYSEQPKIKRKTTRVIAAWIVNEPVSSSLKLSYAEQSDSLCDVGASSSANFRCTGRKRDAVFLLRGRCRVFGFPELLVLPLHWLDSKELLQQDEVDAVAGQTFDGIALVLVAGGCGLTVIGTFFSACHSV